MTDQLGRSFPKTDPSDRLSVVVFACRWRHFKGDDLMALKRLAQATDLNLIKVPCSAEVRQEWLSRALLAHADVVLVLGGHPAHCRFAGERDRVLARTDSLKETTLSQGSWDERRLVFDWSDGDPSSLMKKVDGILDCDEHLG